MLSASFLLLVRKLDDVVPLRLFGLLLFGLLVLALFIHFGIAMGMCDACALTETDLQGFELVLSCPKENVKASVTSLQTGT